MNGGLRFPTTIPFGELLGLKLVRFEAGAAEITCMVRPELCNSFGHAHGGVLMALLDVAMVHAVRSPSGRKTEPGPKCVTLEQKTSFMRPAAGLLRAHATVIDTTGSLAFCEASVFDADGKLAAKASATFKMLRDASA